MLNGTRNGKIRVFVVEHHRFFRSSVVHWLNQQSALSCCGEADTAAAACRACATAKPDVLLLNLHLPEGDALDFSRELSQTRTGIRVVALVRDEYDFPRHTLPTGVHAWVVKSEATETIHAAIQRVME